MNPPAKCNVIFQRALNAGSFSTTEFSAKFSLFFLMLFYILFYGKRQMKNASISLKNSGGAMAAPFRWNSLDLFMGRVYLWRREYLWRRR